VKRWHRGAPEIRPRDSPDATTAYAALLAWHRSDLSPLSNVPTLDLVVIVVGLPVIATVGGWLLAGGEPPALARQPFE
jgi:putative ABC transport system permease protein